MAFVDWTQEALEGIARHDLWRISRDWEPIAQEIFDAVEAYFGRLDPDEDPHYVPGKPAHRRGKPVDMRIALITVRSKQFRVFFRYTHRTFEIHRVYHPRSKP